MSYNTVEYMDPMPLITGENWDKEIIGKVMETVYAGETHYVAVHGKAELRTLLSDFLESEGKTRSGDVHITAGIQEARFLAIHFLGKTFGKTVLPEVVHPGVRQAIGVRKLDVGFIGFGTDERLLVPVENIKKVGSDGAKVLYLESPSRLNGACYEGAEMDEIAGICKENGVTVILDIGLYPWLNTPCASLANRSEMADSCLIIGEAWPGSGIDEAFVAYMGATADMVKKLAVQKQVLSICTNAPSQNAAIAAAKIYRKKHADILEEMGRVKAELSSSLKGLGAHILPCPLTNFVLCEADLSLQKKLESADVQYIDSKYFGQQGFIQLPVLKAALNRLK